MANLTFPSNPTNGQKFTSNGKVFEYNSTTQRWSVTRAQLLGSLPDDVTIDAPSLSVSLSTIALDESGANVYVTYTVDQDVDASLSVTGIGDTTATLHKSNNTITITAGATEFANGEIILNVTNGRIGISATINVNAVYNPTLLVGGNSTYEYGYISPNDAGVTITHSHQYPANYPISNAFDGNNSTVSVSGDTRFGNTYEILLDWGEGNSKTISKYAMYYRSGIIVGGEVPRGWVLQISDDNVNYTTVDTISSYTWPLGNVLTNFDINSENQIAGRYAKLTFTQVDNIYVSFRELEFWGK